MDGGLHKIHANWSQNSSPCKYARLCSVLTRVLDSSRFLGHLALPTLVAWADSLSTRTMASL